APIPPRVARLAGVLAVAVLVVLTVDGVLYQGLLNTMNAVYSTVDNDTVEGVVQPTQAERSGSPDSPVAWETLGRQGRNFVSGGQDLETLARFAGVQRDGVDVKVPIRVYAGLASTPNGKLEEAAALVVA